MTDALHVLVTNDDGVTAEGLIALRAALLDLGVRVTVIAPDGNRAAWRGRSPSIGRYRWWPPAAPSATASSRRQARRWTACALGLLSDLVPAVDVVASGINHGLNVGDDVTYSGTVGAALEAAVLDVPGVAVSQQAEDGTYRFNDSVLTVNFRHAHRAAQIILEVAQHPPPQRTVLNVNLPAATARQRSH